MDTNGKGEQEIEVKLIKTCNELSLPWPLLTLLDKLGLNVTRNKNIDFDNLKQNLFDLMETENDKFIPFNMISVVDGGVNPEVVQKQQLQTLVDKNQKTNGKLQSIKLLKEELEAQLAVNYPEILEALKMHSK